MSNRPVIIAILAMVFSTAFVLGRQTSAQAQQGASTTNVPTQPVAAVPADQLSESSSLSQNGKPGIDNLGLVALGSIVIAGLTIAIGSIGPALGEGRAVSQALSAIAQQPDSSNTITRTLFVGLAMIESTAIYCFVVAMILLFANPFWKYFIQ